MTNPDAEVTQECLDQNLLEIMSNQETIILHDKYRALVRPVDGDFTVNAKLPDGLVCDHCVFQW